MTYEQFCAEYKPGSYGHDTSADSVQHDADILQRILAHALYRLDEYRRAA